MEIQLVETSGTGQGEIIRAPRRVFIMPSFNWGSDGRIMGDPR